MAYIFITSKQQKYVHCKIEKNDQQNGFHTLIGIRPIFMWYLIFFPKIFKYIQYFPNLYLNFIQSVLYFCTHHWYLRALTIQTYFTFFRCFWFSCRIWMDFVSTLWAVEAPTAKFICNGNPWLKKKN